MFFVNITKFFNYLICSLINSYYFTITNSLQMMLSYPRLKREVWDQLQPLKQRLNN